MRYLAHSIGFLAIILVVGACTPSRSEMGLRPVVSTADNHPQPASNAANLETGSIAANSAAGTNPRDTSGDNTSPPESSVANAEPRYIVANADELRAFIGQHGGARLTWKNGDSSVFLPDGTYYYEYSKGNVNDGNRGTYLLEGNGWCIDFAGSSKDHLNKSGRRCDTLLPGNVIRNEYRNKSNFTLTPLNEEEPQSKIGAS